MANARARLRVRTNGPDAGAADGAAVDAAASASKDAPRDARAARSGTAGRFRRRCDSSKPQTPKASRITANRTTARRCKPAPPREERREWRPQAPPPRTARRTPQPAAPRRQWRRRGRRVRESGAETYERDGADDVSPSGHQAEAPAPSAPREDVRPPEPVYAAPVAGGFRRAAPRRRSTVREPAPGFEARAPTRLRRAGRLSARPLPSGAEAAADEAAETAPPGLVVEAKLTFAVAQFSGSGIHFAGSRIICRVARRAARDGR